MREKVRASLSSFYEGEKRYFQVHNGRLSLSRNLDGPKCAAVSESNRRWDSRTFFIFRFFSAFLVPTFLSTRRGFLIKNTVVYITICTHTYTHPQVAVISWNQIHLSQMQKTRRNFSSPLFVFVIFPFMLVKYLARGNVYAHTHRKLPLVCNYFEKILLLEESEGIFYGYTSQDRHI